MADKKKKFKFKKKPAEPTRLTMSREQTLYELDGAPVSVVIERLRSFLERDNAKVMIDHDYGYYPGDSCSGVHFRVEWTEPEPEDQFQRRYQRYLKDLESYNEREKANAEAIKQEQAEKERVRQQKELENKQSLIKRLKKSLSHDKKLLDKLVEEIEKSK